MFDCISRFIQWCNSNAGFTDAMLSFLTIIISSIAIWVSVKTAKLPFKKKLSITHGVYLLDNYYQLVAIITNSGMRDVYLSYAYIDTDNGLTKDIPQQAAICLKPGETFLGTIVLPGLRLENLLEEYPDLSDSMLYVYVKETTGEEIVKRIGTIKESIDSIKKKQEDIHD